MIKNHLLFTVPEAAKSKIGMLWLMGSACFLPDGCVPIITHMVEGASRPPGSLWRTLIPFMRAPPSGPKHLIPHSFGFRISTYEFWGDLNIQSLALCKYSVPIKCSLIVLAFKDFTNYPYLNYYVLFLILCFYNFYMYSVFNSWHSSPQNSITMNCYFLLITCVIIHLQHYFWYKSLLFSESESLVNLVFCCFDILILLWARSYFISLHAV